MALEKHELVIEIVVDHGKLDKPVDDWVSVRDVVDAHLDGIILQGEITNYTYKGEA